jgi:serine/threonine protein kinase, bacterial
MRYVDGPDLLTVLREKGHLEPGHAVTLLAQIAGALDQAHSLGLVHRDLSRRTCWSNDTATTNTPS